MHSVKPIAAKSTAEYIEQIDEPRRGEIAELDKFIRRAVPELEPFVLQGTAPMLGYGAYRYRYASGREGDTAVVALASQKNHISVYVTCDEDIVSKYAAEQPADRLGAVDLGKSCIRFKRLEDANLDAIAEVLREAASTMGSKLETAAPSQK
jgi:hypothetical protein